MAITEAQLRVIDEEMRRFAEGIRNLIAQKQASFDPRWALNGLDSIADDEVISRDGLPDITGAQIKQVKAAFDALATAATADANAVAVINALCVRGVRLSVFTGE